MARFRYLRWDGDQDPYGVDVDVAEVLDAMSDDLLEGSGAGEALRRLQELGLAGRFGGLEELRRRLQEARRRAAEALDLSGPLEEVRNRLDDILDIERLELAQLDDEGARFQEAVLDALPQHPAGAIRELAGYRWASPDARARFRDLVEELRREVLNAHFDQIAGGLESMTPEHLERIKDMLADLNDMLARRARGEAYSFDAFMERHGHHFPDRPSTLDELLEAMAGRMAAMSRLMAGLSPGQRRELAELASAVLSDLDLAWEVDRLESQLRELMPGLQWDQDASGVGEGDGALPISATVDAIERLSDLEDLEAAARGDYPGASLEDIDEDKLRSATDEDAVGDLQRLKAIERALERAGLVNRSRGRLELTARGARLLGEKSLTKVLERVRRDPTHRTRGGQAEVTGATRPWVFGDSDPISVERTVYNAVTRTGPAMGGRPGAGSTPRTVRLSAQDFEVVETEARPRTATALLLDLSFSMPLGGHWVPAKRMALALNALVEGKYPQDSLHLIGFSDYARQMTPPDLAVAGWEHVHGTNMQHAFTLARRLLVDDPRAIKQVIMVTDGEPTAHLDGEEVFFNWPPVRITVEKTLREAARLARVGISLNVFMLEQSPGLVAFMNRLAKVTGGEVFHASSSEIGEVIVQDYVRRRAGRRAS
ncbi:MAG: hypothetical protein M3333_00715 [Actinomycetota bacterium]|nr:hypothetical protein [Actinomycetota bacterium]